jgi:hypothetical protein
MLRKTVLTLSTSAMLAAAVIAPNAALAFGLLPLPHLGLGVPHLGLGGPHLGLGGPHLGLGGPHQPPHLGGPVGHLGRGGFSGLERSGIPSGVRGSARYGRGAYAHSGSRHHGRGRYADYGSGGYGYGSGGSSADDGCSYTYTSNGRRVLICSDN